MFAQVSVAVYSLFLFKIIVRRQWFAYVTPNSQYYAAIFHRHRPLRTYGDGKYRNDKVF